MEGNGGEGGKARRKMVSELKSEGDEEGRSGGRMNGSIKKGGDEGLECRHEIRERTGNGREEATTCRPPSLILNEMLLIKVNPSVCPPGSHGWSRHTDHSIRSNSMSYNMSPNLYN